MTTVVHPHLMAMCLGCFYHLSKPVSQQANNTKCIVKIKENSNFIKMFHVARKLQKVKFTRRTTVHWS